jgi:hypothetical protein
MKGKEKKKRREEKKRDRGRGVRGAGRSSLDICPHVDL